MPTLHPIVQYQCAGLFLTLNNNTRNITTIGTAGSKAIKYQLSNAVPIDESFLLDASRVSCPAWYHCQSSSFCSLKSNQHHPDSTIQHSFSGASTESSAPKSSNSHDTADQDTQPSRIPRRRRKSNLSNPEMSTNMTPNSDSLSSTTSTLRPLTQEEYDPKNAVTQIQLASRWNQGRLPGQTNSKIRYRYSNYKERKWDYRFVQSAVDEYERHLQYVLDHLKSIKESQSSGDNELPHQQTNSKSSQNDKTSNATSISSSSSDHLFFTIHPSPEKCAETHHLLSPTTLASAMRALTRSKLDTPVLSKRIRDIERLVGNIGWTPITEHLSYRLLEANGKAGNVRRTLALLELRRRRGYVPRERAGNLVHSATEEVDSEAEAEEGEIHPGEKEFIHAITSIQSAQLPLRRSRNIYLHESSFPESALDNPTRYLDAILINMSQRGVPLRPAMAARMLNCYASTGRTGRGLHYFYKVKRDVVEEDGVYIPGPHPTHLGKRELEEWKEARRREGLGRILTGTIKENNVKTKEGENVSRPKDALIMEAMDDHDEKYDGMPMHSNYVTKVRMIMHPPPPFHKIPSSVKGSLLTQNRDHKPFSFEGVSKGSASSSTVATSSSMANVSQTDTPCLQKTNAMTKYEWELERDWSTSLTAAFAFADSLTHGACGHGPIELDLVCWNTLIKACCYRGALHRALKILNETMPQKGIEPDSVSYNTILAGLARVVS